MQGMIGALRGCAPTSPRCPALHASSPLAPRALRSSPRVPRPFLLLPLPPLAARRAPSRLASSRRAPRAPRRAPRLLSPRLLSPLASPPRASPPRASPPRPSRLSRSDHCPAMKGIKTVRGVREEECVKAEIVLTHYRRTELTHPGGRFRRRFRFRLDGSFVSGAAAGMVAARSRRSFPTRPDSPRLSARCGVPFVTPS